MDFVFWIILLVVIVGVVWWLLKRSSSAKAPGASTAERTRADGALSGGSAAASAEAAGTTGIAGAAGFGRPAEPAAPTTADDHVVAAAPAPATDTDRTAGTKEREESGPASPAVAASGTSAASETSAAPAASGQDARRRDNEEWETQWSEASGSSVVAPGAESRGGTSTGGVPTHAAQVNPAGGSGVPAATGQQAEPAAVPNAESHRAPVHHPEYTEPHAPTLPGAETAAVEGIDDAGTAAQAPMRTSSGARQPEPEDSSTAPAAPGMMSGHAATTETADRTQSSALVETGADRTQQPPAAPATEPAGHLAADEPYGAGSAAAGADGSGPDGYTVKGDAGAMVYYEEGHPDYEPVRADVWFESEAHAEAAGFRAPRRRRP
ncbi:hypothetical protein ACIQF8_02000 [Pseudarthrobacter sp. NPDC092184]|uniref:sunset domain-containing protein n=1 Tax=unclassified Pseudarthrobacter TaxID=2647000 RepID=UPI0037F125C3